MRKKFTNKYKSILHFKHTNEYDFYSYIQYIHFTVAFIILSSIFVGLGTLTNYINNLNYVLFIINGAIFGAYVFMRLYYESLYKKEFTIKYDSYIAIIPDSARVLSIQLGISSFLGLFLFWPLMNAGTIILFAVLSLVSIIVNNVLLASVVNPAREDYQGFAYGLFTYLLLVTLFKVIPVMNVVLHIWIAAILVLILFLLNYIIKFRDLDKLSSLGIKFLIILILIIFPNNSAQTTDSYDYFGSIPQNPNVTRTEFDTFKYSGPGIFLRDGEVMLQGYNKIIDDRINNESRIVFIESDLMVESIYESEGVFYRTLFDTDEAELVIIESEQFTFKPTYNHQEVSFVYFSYILEFKFYNDQLYILTTDSIYTFNQDFQETMRIDSTSFPSIEDYLGIDETDDLSSNGDTLIKNETDDYEFIVNNTGTTRLNYIPEKNIIDFHSSSDRYVLVTSSQMISYDKKGNFIEMLHYNSYNNVYEFYNDKMVFVSFDDGEILFHQLNLSDLSKPIFRVDRDITSYSIFDSYNLEIGTQKAEKIGLKVYVELIAFSLLIIIPFKRDEYIVYKGDI